MSAYDWVQHNTAQNWRDGNRLWKEIMKSVETKKAATLFSSRMNKTV